MTATAPAPTSFNTGANPLIPTTISQTCQTYLGTLNADTTVSACTAPLNDILTLFAPSAATTFSANQAQVDQTLETLCQATPCSQNMIRQKLNDFYGNCTAELNQRNPVVLAQFDTLYIVSPLLSAVCSKDVNGGSCLTDIATGSVPAGSLAANSTSNATTPLAAISNTATAPLSSLAAAPLPLATLAPSVNQSRNASVVSVTANATVLTNSSRAVVLAASPSFTIQTYAGAALDPRNLYTRLTAAATRFARRFGKRQATAGTASALGTPLANGSSIAPANSPTAIYGALPNIQTWTSTGLPFMFLSQNMSSNILCTTCTKEILGAYVSWELRQPYALGLGNSPLLSKQSDLWTGIGEVCGTGFLSAVAQEAGAQIASSGGSKLEKASGAALAFAVVAIVISQSI